MKVYTVQDKDFLEFVDSNGFILPNIKENLEPDLEEWLKDMSDVYFWMAEKYHEKTGLPNDRCLFWFYFRMRDINWRHINFDKYNVYCFEVPKKLIYKNFLWSDLIDWHWHLNHLEGWETKIDIFDLNLNKYAKNVVPQGVTTRIRRDWIKKIYTKSILK